MLPLSLTSAVPVDTKGITMSEETPELGQKRRRERIDYVMYALYGIGAVMAGFLVWWTLDTVG